MYGSSLVPLTYLFCFALFCVCGFVCCVHFRSTERRKQEGEEVAGAGFGLGILLALGVLVVLGGLAFAVKVFVLDPNKLLRETP